MFPVDGVSLEPDTQPGVSQLSSETQITYRRENLGKKKNIAIKNVKRNIFSVLSEQFSQIKT